MYVDIKKEKKNARKIYHPYLIPKMLEYLSNFHFLFIFLFVTNFMHHEFLEKTNIVQYETSRNAQTERKTTDDSPVKTCVVIN